MRFIAPLDPLNAHWLLSVEHSSEESIRTRNRAQAIRLSASNFPIKDLSKIFGVCQDTIGIWLTNWERQGFDGLKDAPGKGRKLKIKQSQEEQVLSWVREEPRQLKYALDQFRKTFHEVISSDTLKRLLKKRNFPGSESENH